MKGARIANRLILVKHDGILELVRPKPGEASYANAEEYSRIDFRAILGQWQSLLKSGHSLLINFADGATIELSNFFDSDISNQLVVQIDDATYVAPEFLLQQFSILETPSTVGQTSTVETLSGAYFVGPLAEHVDPLSSDLSGSERSIDPHQDTSSAPPDWPFLPPAFTAGSVPSIPSPPEPPPEPNSAPTITQADSTGGVIEDIPPPTQTGIVTFADSDLPDVHSVSVTTASGGYLGTFVANISDDSTGDGSGQVTWNFSVDNAALQFLAQGQQLTQIYTLTIDDGAGGIATQEVVV